MQNKSQKNQLKKINNTEIDTKIKRTINQF